MNLPELKVSKEYRIHRLGPGTYQLSVTHGLLDVEHLGWFGHASKAREFAKDHAKKAGVQPIILTQ